MSETIFLMFVALLGVGIGVAVGMLIGSLRPGKTAEQESSPKSHPNLIEVAKIWQDRKSGQPYPEINGKVVRFPADLTAGQRERLAATLEVLLGWLKPSAEVGERLAPQKPTAAGMDALSQPSTSSSSSWINPVDVIARAMQPEVRPAAGSDKSMAMQIDEILQEKLAASGMANKGIRLVELPSKDLAVMVGLNQYPGIDAVPDAEIQRLIRESAAEWERRTGDRPA